MGAIWRAGRESRRRQHRMTHREKVDRTQRPLGLERCGGGCLNRRTTLLHDSLLEVSGIALARDEFLPCFEPMKKTSCDFSPAGATGIQLDNSTIRIYPDDFNHRGPLPKKLISQKGRGVCTQNGWGVGRGEFGNSKST